MFNGMFDDYIQQTQNEKFDLIILSMVLEHIINPFSFISKCKELCNRYIFIEVPILDIKRSGDEPMGLLVEEHVNLFTIDSLGVLMRKIGFILVNAEVICEWDQYLPAAYPSVRTIWEKEKLVEEKSFRYNLFTSEEMLDKYVQYSMAQMKVINSKIDDIPNNMKLAIWGIGHHASMLLANTSLKEKNIVRAYDSDARKHGMLFAGISVMGFDMADITYKNVEGILITTYTAQKSILAYVKRKSVTCPIYYLYDL